MILATSSWNVQRRNGSVWTVAYVFLVICCEARARAHVDFFLFDRRCLWISSRIRSQFATFDSRRYISMRAAVRWVQKQFSSGWSSNRSGASRQTQGERIWVQRSWRGTSNLSTTSCCCFFHLFLFVRPWYISRKSLHLYSHSSFSWTILLSMMFLMGTISFVSAERIVCTLHRCMARQIRMCETHVEQHVEGRCSGAEDST